MWRPAILGLLGLLVHALGASTLQQQEDVVSLDAADPGAESPLALYSVTSGVMTAPGGAAVNTTGCDPPSLASLPGQPATTGLPFRLAVSIGAEFHCLTSSAGGAVLAPCRGSEEPDKWSQLFELTPGGLVQLSHDAGETVGTCATRKGCLTLTNDTELSLGSCAEALANDGSVHWRYVDGQLKTKDSRCLLAGSNQLPVVDACPAALLTLSTRVRVMDGLLGDGAWKGKLCRSPCYERTGAEWEDDLSMPHGWCFGDFVAERNASIGANVDLSWGSCARVGSQIEPHKEECAVVEESPEQPERPKLGETVHTKKKPRAKRSDKDVILQDLRAGWAAMPMLQGRRLLQNNNTIAEVENTASEVEQLKAATERRTGAHRKELKLRQQLLKAKAASKAASEACAAAKRSVDEGLEKTKAAYARAEKGSGDPSLTEQAKSEAAKMKAAEGQVKEWCEKERSNDAMVADLEDQHERAKSSVQKLEELSKEEGALIGAVSGQKKAKEKIKQAKEKLLRARKKATRASAEVGAAYELAVQYANQDDDANLAIQQDNLNAARSRLLAAHVAHDAAQLEVVKARREFKKDYQEQIDESKEAAASLAEADVEREIDGDKPEAGSQPVMPSLADLLDAAKANEGIKSVSNGRDQWVLLPEETQTIGSNCATTCVPQVGSEARVRCIKKCKGYESGQDDGKQWRALCEVLQVSECNQGECSVSRASRCSKLEIATDSTGFVVASSPQGRCPAVGSRTQYCTSW